MSSTYRFRFVQHAAVLMLPGLLILFVMSNWLAAGAAPPIDEVGVTSVAPLSFVNVSANDVQCLFHAECDPTVDNATALFTYDGMDGAGYLQARTWTRGQPGTTGAGLYSYLYRIDLEELVSTGNPACINNFALDFGPVVPLDYNGDNNLDHGFIISSGEPGSIAPSSVDLTNGRLTFTFATPICGEFDVTDGNSSFFFGLASPFGNQEVTAVFDDWLEVLTRAPDFSSDPTLQVFPSDGLAGETVQLIGSGYLPGGYAGTIRWNGADVETMTIPSGGAFAQPFTIPVTAATADHTIAVCSLNPCATGDFEQIASAPFGVYGRLLSTLTNHIYLPAVRNDGLAVAQPFSYSVNPDVTPFEPELPGLDGGTPRPLAAVRDPRGQVATFVANELVVQTDDTAALNALLARTGGEILLELDPTEAGISDLPKIFLVRANLDAANMGGFTTNINTLMDDDIQSAGHFAYSSNDGTRIFALAAAEAVNGLTVGINWVSEPDAIPISSREAINGPTVGGVAYTPNAYNWVYLAQGTVQDIGVPEAWTLMHRAGRLSNQVNLAILDGGFYPNADFPTNTTYLSAIPFIPDPRNVDGVDGSAPFHGTDVLQTAVGVSDDNFGIVGVAAPVARPIAVYTTYDYVISIGSVLLARAAGADIINMSYSASVPAVFGWTVWPFEATTAALRASGTLLFASAGNNGQNVDGQDCFLGICWEHTWHTPCENAGVICVGGLGWNSQRRHDNSNHGPNDVDIYAPYTVYRGRSPATPNGGNTVGIINGTSFSSPYVASVAALIWASDPSLSANQVWAIMRDTAHSSPDTRVNRYVNAYDAVLTAIDIGVGVELRSPTHGGIYPKNFPVYLAANVGYVAAGSGIPVQVQWRVNGSLINTTTYTPGSGSHVLYPQAYAHGLSEGTHTASIRVTAGSTVINRSATFTIENSPPTASIDQPASGSTFCSGETIILRGSAYDPNQPGGLPDSAFAWHSNVNGNLGTGATRPVSTLSAGSHVITLRVTDDGGLWDEDSINLTILANTHPDCQNLPPSAVITSPASGTSFMVDSFDGTYWYKQITFTGMVGDAEDPISDLDVQWLSNLQGSLGTPTVNPVTGETTITANIRLFDGCSSAHTITLRVEDTDGNVTEDEIVIHVWILC